MPVRFLLRRHKTIKMKQIIVSLITVLLLTFSTNLLAAETILKAISPEEKDGQFMVNFISDKSAEFISYSLSEPPRVILEPIIQDVFTDLSETVLMENDLVKAVKIIKDDGDKISSIIIELKQNSSYHLVSDTNLVSVYLTPQPEEQTLVDPLAEANPQLLDQAVETEMERIQKLNKLIAPTKLPPTPSISKPYPLPGRPNTMTKPPAYPASNLPNQSAEQ